MTGAIPAELGSLTNLQAVAQGNQLTGAIPAELGRPVQPDSWSVPLQQPVDRGDTGGVGGPDQPGTGCDQPLSSGNQLTGEIPAELGSLTNLKRLYLNSNQLTGEIPAELGDLAWNGCGSDNQLTGEIPA